MKMDYNGLCLRTTKQDCHCKICDRLIERNTEKLIVFRSYRGHGDTTHICLDCVDKINEMMREEI